MLPLLLCSQDFYAPMAFMLLGLLYSRGIYASRIFMLPELLSYQDFHAPFGYYAPSALIKNIL